MITRNTIIVAIGTVIIIVVGAVIFTMLTKNNAPLAPATGTQVGGLPPVAGGTTLSGAPTSAFIGETRPATGGETNKTGGGFLSGTPTPSPSGSKAGGSGTSPASSGKGGKVAITARTLNGGTAKFTVTPTAHDASGDYYFSTSTVYDIAFFPDGGFIITLMNPNLIMARQNAETAFLKVLGITDRTINSPACALTVSLGVPRGVSEEALGNDNAAGVNYGLSFCDGSIKNFPS